jgi:hypothetical protein
MEMEEQTCWPPQQKAYLLGRCLILQRYKDSMSEYRTSVRDPAGHLRATIRNPLVVNALQASQVFGRDRIPPCATGVRWIRGRWRRFGEGFWP